MSVILYGPHDDLWQTLATAYESLKPLLRQYGHEEERSQNFYQSLRRLYFANVATWLCQYHDGKHMAASELAESIDPFTSMTPGRFQFPNQPLMHVRNMHTCWGRLKYNLATNDGEQYRPVKAFEFMEDVILMLTREALDWEAKEQERRNE